MHDGSINRGGRRGREPAESQSAATYPFVSLSLSLSLSLTFFLSRKPSGNSMKPELSREQSAGSPIMQKSAIITCNSTVSDPKELGISFRNSQSFSNSMCSWSEEIWNSDR